MPVATETFREFILPCIGMFTSTSHRVRTVFLSPFALGADHKSQRNISSRYPTTDLSAAASAPTMVIPSLLHFVDCMFYIRHHGNRNILYSTC